MRGNPRPIMFGEWTPDQPALWSDGLVDAKNCVPLTGKSYGPFNSLEEITPALGSACLGAEAFRSSDGTVYLFAGTEAGLFKYDAGTNTWEDVSKVGGYTTPSDGRWFFAMIYGYVIATNYVDAVQSFDVMSSTDFADLSASAPKARYVCAAKDFLILLDTNDGTDGEQQSRAWWSAFGDPTSWPTVGSAAAEAAQSDFSDLWFGGQITGAAGGVGGNDLVIFCQRAIYRMNYGGPPTVFTIDEAERERGTTVPGSIINAGQFAAYIGEEGPALFNGAQSIPIGAQKIDRYFWDSVQQTALNRVCAAVDAKRRLLIWAYPTTSSTSAPDRMLFYHLETGRWSHVDVEIEFILRGYTAGYTEETLPGASLDDLPFTADSAAWQGGRVVQGGFSTNHKFGFFQGDSLEATLETGDFMQPDGRRSHTTGARPLCDAATVTMQIGHRDALSEAVTWETATSPAGNGICPFLKDARFLRTRLIVASAQDWTHAMGFIPDVTPSGWR